MWPGRTICVARDRFREISKNNIYDVLLIHRCLKVLGW